MATKRGCSVPEVGERSHSKCSLVLLASLTSEVRALVAWRFSHVFLPEVIFVYSVPEVIFALFSSFEEFPVVSNVKVHSAFEVLHVMLVVRWTSQVFLRCVVLQKRFISDATEFEAPWEPRRQHAPVLCHAARCAPTLQFSEASKCFHLLLRSWVFSRASLLHRRGWPVISTARTKGCMSLCSEHVIVLVRRRDTLIPLFSPRNMTRPMSWLKWERAELMRGLFGVGLAFIARSVHHNNRAAHERRITAHGRQRLREHLVQSGWALVGADIHQAHHLDLRSIFRLCAWGSAHPFQNDRAVAFVRVTRLTVLFFDLPPMTRAPVQCVLRKIGSKNQRTNFVSECR